MSWAEFLTLLDGAGVTIAISLLSIAIGAPLGLGLAVIRWRRVPLLDPLVATLVSMIRATPMVTLVLLVYFALPGLGLSLSRFEAAIGSLAIGTMAYDCEIFRGALLAFPKDQVDAALACGMGRGLRFRRIVLPQLLRSCLPGLVNEITLLIKVSPAVAVIGFVETTRAAVRIGAATYDPIPPFLVALVLYILIIVGFVLLQRGIERRVRLAA